MSDQVNEKMLEIQEVTNTISTLVTEENTNYKFNVNGEIEVYKDGNLVGGKIKSVSQVIQENDLTEEDTITIKSIGSFAYIAKEGTIIGVGHTEKVDGITEFPLPSSELALTVGWSADITGQVSEVTNNLNVKVGCNTLKSLGTAFNVVNGALTLVKPNLSSADVIDDGFAKISLVLMGAEALGVSVSLPVSVTIGGVGYASSKIASELDEFQANMQSSFNRHYEPIINAANEAGIELGGYETNLMSHLRALKMLEEMNDAREAEVVRCEPIILDLDGDGVETNGSENGVYFDLDSNGFAEKSGWVDKDDGLLVRDVNGNGIIDDGAELFGDSTLLEDGTKAPNGFAALTELDENRDEVIDSLDSAFNDLKVWKDINSDGQSSDDELFQLEALNIKSLNLSKTDEFKVLDNNNAIQSIGSYTTKDDISMEMSEYLFITDKADTISTGEVEVPDEIKSLPNLWGSGNLNSLQVEMMENEELKVLVESFSKASTYDKRKEILDSIMIIWTKSENVDENSRGVNIDARKLAALEVLSGRNFEGVSGSNPNRPAAMILNNIYNTFSSMFYTNLMKKTHLRNLLEDVVVEVDLDTKTSNKNFEKSKIRIQKMIDENIEVGKDILREFIVVTKSYMDSDDNFKKFCDYFVQQNTELACAVDLGLNGGIMGNNQKNILEGLNGDEIIAGFSGDDVLGGNGGSDTLYGGIGNDTLDGGSGDDKLYGGFGDDEIDGGSGDDILIGGTGNDTLKGYRGNDTYVFSKGFGQDVIDENAYISSWGESDRYDIGSVDSIHFTDINSDEIEWEASGSDRNDMSLRIKGTEDVITMRDYISNSKKRIERIEFGDGEVWDEATIESKFSSIENRGTEEADELKGSDSKTFSDKLYGQGGNDIIKGYKGDDELYGGSGDDALDGGEDKDTLYGGIGNDTLDGGSGDDKLYGGFGDDEIDGGSGDDILIGGTGNDTLKGYRGNDTYVFSKGFGQDVIDENAYISSWGESDRYDIGSVDSIHFTDINSDEIEWEASGSDRNDMSLRIKGTEDVITMRDYISNSKKRIERIEFGDGEVWDEATIESKFSSIENRGTEEADELKGSDSKTFSDKLYGQGGNDIIKGYKGDDELYGGSGDDALDGGEDKDTLYGGIGNDTLDGGSGDDKLYGGFGDDEIDGGSGDDILIGGTGNDTLKGYRGNDTYVFSKGFGQDVIDENAYISSWGESDRYDIGSVDSIHFTDINSDEIEWEASGSDRNDMSLRIKGTEDVITMRDYISNSEKRIERIEFGGGEVWDEATIESKFSSIEKRGTEEADELKGSDSKTFSDKLYGQGGNDIIKGYKGDDELYGGSGDDALDGGEDKDTLYGGIGNDTLDGGSGDDKLYGGFGDDEIDGGSGDDILIGGTGNDTLKGYRGNDTYVFSKGFGQDVIDENAYISSWGESDRYDIGSVDSIHFTDINSDEIEWEASGSDRNDMSLRIKGTEDVITMRDYISNSEKRIERIEFGDGEVWDEATIESKFSSIENRGTEEADELKGSDSKTFSDKLYGQGGNDIIKGYKGDDELYGGSGDDALDGGEDKDTLYGGIGNDTLDGGSGDDILIGGTGNDTLKGYRGNDTYVFSKGFGQDVLDENAYISSWGESDRYDIGSVDSIHFTDINSDEIEWEASGSDRNDMSLRIKGTEDVITMRDYISNSEKRIERIEFGGGEVWDEATIKSKFSSIENRGTEEADELKGSDSKTFSDKLYGQGGNDIIKGYKGDDELYGGSGDDALDGGEDKDTLYGGIGNDTLDGGSGDDKLYGGFGDDEIDGGSGDDILIGGTGNDTLKGYRGNDTYVFSKGFGQDVIDENAYISSWGESDRYDIGSVDSIHFTDINSDEIEWEASGSDRNDMSLRIKGTEDVITMRDYISNSKKRIERIEFGDGEVWDEATIESKFSSIENRGTEEADELKGSDSKTFSDKLYGQGGNDIIKGYKGDDELYGGSGDDALDGGYGDDHYIFTTSNEGSDTITDAHGCDDLLHTAKIENTIFEISNKDLVISFHDNEDEVLVKNNCIENYEFNGEYLITSSQIDLLIQSMNEFCTENGVTNWNDALNTHRDETIDIVFSFASKN
ncbi:calcium-binding protein [Fusibacter sp. JL216-2]|uniref:calcium-binding protein n=1 Tax=Fusibacter sp. JL216-2 TaxID=3071453 RepID=UPI003D35229D